MKVRITSKFCHLKNVGIVKLFFISGVPFTFEEEGFDPEDPIIVAEAAVTPEFSMDDIFRWSDYLIAEECHPLLFDMEDYVENYQDVPD